MSYRVTADTRSGPPAEDVSAAVAESWNGESGRRWVESVDYFDTLLEPMGAAVLSAARPQPGERVLEVGSGTGQMALQACRLVAPGGSVVGVDVSGPMTELARRRAAESGVGNLELVVADAASVEIPPSRFDVLVSRFGLMFFADPAAAFSHLVTRLRPGGRLAAVVWQDRRHCELFSLPAEVVARHLPEAAAVAPGPGMPGMFSLSDPAAARRLLLDAGATDVLLESHRRLLTVGRDLDEAVSVVRESSVFRPVLDAGGAVVEAVEEDLRRAMSDHLGPSGVELSAAAWLITARRPA